MSLSAIRSSSIVLTPGRHASLRGGGAAVGRADGVVRRVGALALRTDGPARQPLEQLLDRDAKVDHPVEALAQLDHERVEGVGLGNGTRKAVDDEARLAVRLAEAVADHADHDLVGDVLARSEDGLRLATELGAGGDLRPEHVAGGDVRDAELRAEHVGLGPLSGPGRAIQQQIHLINPRYWRITSCVCSCFIVSSATPTTIRMAVPPRYICC